MQRFQFFTREAFRALTRSAAPSFAAMLTIMLTALVLGVFIPVVQATTGTANSAGPSAGNTSWTGWPPRWGKTVRSASWRRTTSPTAAARAGRCRSPSSRRASGML